MRRLSFELTSFSFDHESETGLHRSTRTPHHLFVKLGPGWLNGCPEWVQIRVGTSQTIPFHNRPESKVHVIDNRTWAWSIQLVPKTSEIIILAPLLGRICCVSSSTVLCDVVIILKSFCEPRKNSFPQYVHINLDVDFHAFNNEDPSNTKSGPNITVTGLWRLKWLLILTDKSLSYGHKLFRFSL